METAVLLMDMPEHCCTCPLWIIDGYETDLCKFTERKIKDVFEHKPDWCPLVPEPKRFNARISDEDLELISQNYIADSEFELGKKVGFDNCLNKLEGKGNG